MYRCLPRFRFRLMVTLASVLAAGLAGARHAASAETADSGSAHSGSAHSGSADSGSADSGSADSGSADSDEARGGGTNVLEEIRNDAPRFAVHVDVDRADATYAIGDLIRVSVRSERDGYLYVLWVDAGRNVSCVFPNKLQQSNQIKAGEAVSVPAAGSGFKLRIAPPTGGEIVKAIVTASPLQSMQHDRLIVGDKTVLSAGEVRGLKGETGGRTDWAEDDVAITTVAAREAATRGHRHGLFIGVSRHADSRIPPRPASGHDAGQLAEAVGEKGGFKTAEVVIDEKATRQFLQDAVMTSLRKATSPGDTILISWSGRVGFVADDDGDEAGGCDAVFLPHDARADDEAALRSSGIVDDELFRWLQDLDGRSVVVVLDGCDGIGSPKPDKPPVSPSGFLDHEVDRLQKMGKRRITVIAASRPGETPLVKPDGTASEFSSLLADCIRNAGDRLSIREAFDAISEPLSSLARSRDTPVTPSITGDVDAVLLATGTASPHTDGAK